MTWALLGLSLGFLAVAMVALSLGLILGLAYLLQKFIDDDLWGGKP